MIHCLSYDPRTAAQCHADQHLVSSLRSVHECLSACRPDHRSSLKNFDLNKPWVKWTARFQVSHAWMWYLGLSLIEEATHRNLPLPEVTARKAFSLNPKGEQFTPGRISTVTGPNKGPNYDKMPKDASDLAIFEAYPKDTVGIHRSRYQLYHSRNTTYTDRPPPDWLTGYTQISTNQWRKP